MKYENFIIKNAGKIIIATSILIGLSIIPLFFIRINPDLESYIPDDIDAKLNMNKISAVFGAEENLLLLVGSEDILDPATLEQVTTICSGLEQIEGISHIYSICQAKNIMGLDGSLIADQVLPANLSEPFNRDSLRNIIMQNDLVYNILVSEDFKETLIILTIDKSINDHDLIHSIMEIMQSVKGNAKVSMTGMAYLREEANKKISADLILLLPLGIIVMFLFLLLAFKNLKGVLLPMSVVMISILVSMALIPLFGWELGLIGVLIPIMMLAISNNYGVHVFSRYQEEIDSKNGKTNREIVADVIKYLKRPVFLTGLTTMAGVLGLVTHILLPAAQMGVVASISIGLALILSVSFIPAIMIYLKPDLKIDRSSQAPGLMQKILAVTASFVTRHTRCTIGVFIIFFLLSMAGLSWFKVAPDSNNVLPSDHPFNVAAQTIDQKFGGSKMIQIMFKGDIRDPQLLRKIEISGNHIKKIEGVGSVNSITTIIKKISSALNEPGTTEYNSIPDKFETIAQYIELYNMSGDPGALEQFADFNYEHSLLTIQYSATDMKTIQNIVKSIRESVKNDDRCEAIGGYSLVDQALGESVFLGQNYSLLFAFIVIAFLLSWIFKSIYAGILGSLPLIFAVFVTFGLMGWLGIELNIVTALLSSISIGLGVDFTIHMFWRLKSEIHSGKNITGAVITSITTIGRGISINALSVIAGFSVLFFSAFPLIHSFAFLIIISIFMCLLCSLLLIPAICLMIKPRFLYY